MLPDQTEAERDAVALAAEMKQADRPIRYLALGNDQEMTLMGGAGLGALVEHRLRLCHPAMARPWQVFYDLGIAGVIREQRGRVGRSRRAEHETLVVKIRRHGE